MVTASEPSWAAVNEYTATRCQGAKRLLFLRLGGWHRCPDDSANETADEAWQSKYYTNYDTRENTNA